MMRKKHKGGIDRGAVGADNPTVTFADLLRGRIGALGITQTEAAKRMKITQPQVSRWLKGALPADDQLAAVRDFLGVDDTTLAGALHATRSLRLGYEERLRRLEGALEEVQDLLRQLGEKVDQMDTRPGGRPRGRSSR